MITEPSPASTLIGGVFLSPPPFRTCSTENDLLSDFVLGDTRPDCFGLVGLLPNALGPDETGIVTYVNTQISLASLDFSHVNRELATVKNPERPLNQGNNIKIVKKTGLDCQVVVL